MSDFGKPTNVSWDNLTRIIHLDLLVFGILAWLTGEVADENKYINGFYLHGGLGLCTTVFIFLRIIYGFIGPASIRFVNWSPYTKNRLKLVREDVLTLFRFSLPDRSLHQGLAGLVQTFGLFVFLWMCITGSVLFLYVEPGHKVRGILHSIKEIHEAGEILIPVFLGLHIGAVLLHAFNGNHKWKNLFKRP